MRQEGPGIGRRAAYPAPPPSRQRLNRLPLSSERQRASSAIGYPSGRIRPSGAPYSYRLLVVAHLLFVFLLAPCQEQDHEQDDPTCHHQQDDDHYQRPAGLFRLRFGRWLFGGFLGRLLGWLLGLFCRLFGHFLRWLWARSRGFGRLLLLTVLRTVGVILECAANPVAAGHIHRAVVQAGVHFIRLADLIATDRGAVAGAVAVPLADVRVAYPVVVAAWIVRAALRVRLGASAAVHAAVGLVLARVRLAEAIATDRGLVLAAVARHIAARRGLCPLGLGADGKGQPARDDRHRCQRQPPRCALLDTKSLIPHEFLSQTSKKCRSRSLLSRFHPRWRSPVRPQPTLHNLVVHVQIERRARSGYARFRHSASIR